MSRYTIDLRPESINGQAWCSVLVTDADTGARVYSDKQDLSQAHIRAKLIAKLAERKYTTESADTLEKTILDAIASYEAQIAEADAVREPPPRCTIRELIDAHPRLHEPVIEGLLRDRETLNIISVSKIGKSWLLYGLLLSIVMGQKWLGRFATKRGRVLLIDNELHRPTIANRLRAVAEAMYLPAGEWLDSVDVWPIRGIGLDIDAIAKHIEKAPAPYALIAIDAKYRAIPARASENDNAAETRYYNTIDRLADTTGSPLANIHHSSKGSQSEKRVTDVGAGAGAQSRAADTHLILREHELENCVVLEAAVRSFAPVEPMGLTWRFPLWVPDADIDTEALKGRKTASEERQDDRDSGGKDQILAALADGPATVRELRRRTGGMGTGRCERLVDALAAAGKIVVTTTKIRGNECRVYAPK